MREPQAMAKPQPVRDACNSMNIMNTFKRIFLVMLLPSLRNREFAHSQQYSLLYDEVVTVPVAPGLTVGRGLKRTIGAKAGVTRVVAPGLTVGRGLKHQ